MLCSNSIQFLFKMTWFIFILGAMIAGFVQGLTGFAFALIAMSFLDLGITTTVGSTIGGVCFAMESYHCIRKRTKTSTPFFPCSPLYYCRIDRCTSRYLSFTPH